MDDKHTAKLDGKTNVGQANTATSFDRVLFSSASDRWATPPDVYAALNAEFDFNFDPCPLDGDKDGLSTLFTEWKGKRVFCNPPYGPGIGEWLKRGFEAEIAVFLIPARTDTRWFHDIVLPNAREIPLHQRPFEIRRSEQRRTLPFDGRCL